MTNVSFIANDDRSNPIEVKNVNVAVFASDNCDYAYKDDIVASMDISDMELTEFSELALKIAYFEKIHKIKLSDIYSVSIKYGKVTNGTITINISRFLKLDDNDIKMQ